MSVIVYDLDRELGKISLNENKDGLKIEGDDNFKRFVSELYDTRKSASDFLENLPSRLKSRVRAIKEPIS